MRGTTSSLSKLTVAIGMATALVLGPLGLHAGADLQSFSSTATGFALRVTVDLSGLPEDVKSQVQDAYGTVRDGLPAEAQAELPADFPFVVDQYFVKTTSDVDDSLARAVSVLGEGFVDFDPVTAEGAGNSSSHTVESVSLPSADLPVVNAVAGLLEAKVTDGRAVSGSATLADVGATLEAIADLLPADLQDAFDVLVATVNGAIDEANTAIDDLSTTVATTVVDNCDDEVLGTVLGEAGLCEGTVEEVAQTLADGTEIPNITNPLALPSLASVTDLVNTTSAAKTEDGKSAASANSQIKAVDVLDGFLNVGLIDLSSHSEVAGSPGSAANTASCEIADVRLGGDNGVALDGENIYVNGSPIPVVGDTVAELKGQVDAVLGEVGITVDLCDETQATAAEDGMSASQSVSAFRIEFAPPAPDVPELEALGIAAGEPLVRVVIDPTVQTAVAAQPQVSGEVALPRTGAPLMGAVLPGLVLALGALAIRRRIR